MSTELDARMYLPSDPRRRYREDQVFHSLVDRFRVLIAQGFDGATFTPTEIREALLLAVIQHELERPAPAYIVDAERALDILVDRDRNERPYRGG